jgi:rhodanese-related sulfurtransferase
MMTGIPAGGYAGDVSTRHAWDDLAKSSAAMLIDVRSQAEWVYVGVPVLSSIGKTTLLVEWDDFTTRERVPDFVNRLKAALDEHGAGRDTPLYFICRSGNRSRTAAIEATAAGYSQCFNIELGFEGRLSPERHRGTAGSWKAENLPWVQS